MKVSIKLPKLFPWQTEFIELGSNKHRIAICSRQSGKTTVSRTLAIKHLIKNEHVLWVAPTYNQLGENYTDIKNLLTGLITRQLTPRQLDVVTGGRIHFRSADKPDTLRGLTNIKLCIFDEAAFACEEALGIIQPILTTVDGKFCLISTPNGHNFFHSHYLRALADKENWYVAKYDWRCSPLLTPEAVEKAQNQLTPQEFRQEYLADFVSPKGALFPAEWVKDALMLPGEPMPENYTRTIIGTDYSLAKDTKSDLQVVVFAGWAQNKLWCEVDAGRCDIDTFNRKIKSMYELRKPQGIAVETNTFQQVAAHNLKKLWQPLPLPPIWEIINNVPKETRIARLATLLQRKQLRIFNNDGGLEAFNELSDFPAPSAHRDVLDAIEQSWRCMCET